VLDTQVNCAKTAEPIGVPLGCRLQTRVDVRNHVGLLDEILIPHAKGQL